MSDIVKDGLCCERFMIYVHQIVAQYANTAINYG